MLVLVLLYPPLILAMSGGLLWLAWQLLQFRFVRLWMFTGAASLGIVAILLLISLFALLIRLSPSPPAGLPLRRESNPAAFQLIERLARRLRVPPPTLILIQPNVNAAIGTYDMRSVGESKRAHVLFLGIPMVLIADTAELAALLCHELAHAATGDTIAGRISHRFFLAMGAALSIHDDDLENFSWVTWVVHLPLLGFFKVFVLLYLFDQRQCEFRADRIAAQVCGPQRTRDMLRKSIRLGGIPQLSIGRILSDAGQREHPPDSIYDLFRERYAAVNPQRWAQAENEAFLQAQSAWSTHPNLAERFRKLSTIDAPELNASRPAKDLFLEWPRIEKEISKQLLALEHEGQQERERELMRMGNR